MRTNLPERREVPFSRRATGVLQQLGLTTTLAVGLLLGGCSGGSSPAPSASAAAPATEAPSAAPGSAAASSATPSASSPAPSETAQDSAAACLNGTHRLDTYSATGVNGKKANGEGGDLTYRFANGGYEVRGKGKKPATLTINNETGQLYLGGSIDGTYKAGDPGSATFSVGKASGSAVTRDPGTGRKGSLSMKQVGNVFAPRGKAKVSCEGNDLTLSWAGLAAARITAHLTKA